MLNWNPSTRKQEIDRAGRTSSLTDHAGRRIAHPLDRRQYGTPFLAKVDRFSFSPSIMYAVACRIVRTNRTHSIEDSVDSIESKVGIQLFHERRYREVLGQ